MLYFVIGDTDVATIPLEFMRLAHVDNWEYVRYVLHTLADLPETFQLLVNGAQLTEDHPLLPGTYEIQYAGSSSHIKFSRGPQGKSLSRARNTIDDEASDTVSASSRLTGRPEQARFRNALLARDSRCLVTGTRRLVVLTACHIVFQSLGQAYLDEIVGSRNEVLVMDLRNGLLLNNVLHHPYDQFLWGIYYDSKSDRYVVHSFEDDPDDPTSSRAYHGRSLLLNDNFKDTWPHKALLEWQYRQCLMAHVRGFAAGELH